MAKLRDGQRDFSGGMVDRIAPERLGENQYAYGKNVEVRYGGVRSRRGSWLLIPNATDGAGDECEVMGTEIFRYPEPGVADDLVQAIYRPDDDETRLYAVDMPSIGIRAQLTLPETILGRSPMKMVQAYDRLYILRDGAPGWKWAAGDVDSPVEVVADGISGPMPQARDGIYAYNRLWLIEGDDTVIPSDLLDENWDRTTNEFRVEQGDGTRLVALRPFGGGTLLAFKERGVALIRGAFNFANADDLSIEFVSDIVGCVAADTAVQVGADAFFLGRDGVWSIQQTTEQNARLVAVPLSEPIYELVQSINWQHAASSSAVVFDNYYMVAVPTNGSITPNRILVYDLMLQVWVGFWEYDEAQAVDDDGLWRHFSLRKARKGLRDELISIGAYGACGMLCKGDYKDWEAPSVTYLSGNNSPVWIELVNGVSVTMTEFNSGTISATFRSTGAWPVGNKILFNAGSGTLLVYLQGDATGVNYIVVSYSGNYTAYINVPTVEYGGAWHDLSVTHNGSMVSQITLDGISYPVQWDLSSGDLSKWIYDATLVSAYAEIPTNESAFHLDSLEILAPEVGTSNATTPNRILFLFDEGSGNDVTGYWFYGSNSHIAHTYTATGGSLTWGTSSQSAKPSIESVLKTRGMSFGDIFATKTGLRGELRFAHGQPSVTMEMGSDVPFDTETFASLNAKTYSLTDYEVVGRSAWDATNANNDFQTPYREDYAPIALGVQMGAAGLVLDKHREHTELFSSLAIFGWTQFTITNTQGFVRYNGLSLTAQGRNFEQDTGNNGN